MAVSFTLGSLQTSTFISGYSPRWITQAYTTDLNNDGNSDLLVLGASYPSDGAPVAQPSLVAFGNGSGGFTLATQAQFPFASLATVHPREVVFADFNGDGYKDVFIASHGYDANPFPGEQNQLFLSNGNGTWRNATATSLPAISDFTHGASAGDVNGDGALDLIVGNVPRPNPAPPYILINNGAGVFTRNDALLPTGAGQLLNSDNTRMTSQLLADLDGDGLADLVVGTGFSTTARPLPAQILWNQGGSFAAGTATALPLPATSGAQFDVYDIQAIDVNFDGLRDLVVAYQKEGWLGGWELQVLVNQGGRRFVDLTAQYLPDPASRTGGSPSAASAESQYWVQFVHVADLNGDGRMDFTLDARGITSAPATLPVAYIHQADGSFQTVRVSDMTGQNGYGWLFDYSTQYASWNGGSGFVSVQASGGTVTLNTLPVSVAPILPVWQDYTEAVTRFGSALADSLWGGPRQ